MSELRLRTGMGRWLKRTAIGAGTLALIAGGVFAFCWQRFPFPVDRLENWPAGPLVTANDGTTLLDLVGDDDQWRFPVPLDEISPWLIQATVAVEDERFDSHIGVDPIAVVRAAGQNVSAGCTVSGASTLSMQVCRMMDDRPRGWKAKAVESFRALQLERRFDKRQILATYLNIVPYGGNLRGAESASMQYFGKHAADLSLGEAALLAGLPQAPSRYRPDRHPVIAAGRREVVLHRMVELGMISPEQCRTAASEPIVLSRSVSTSIAPHAAWLALERRPGGGHTTIDPTIQREATRLVDECTASLSTGSDVAVVIIDIAESAVVAMVGSSNSTDPIDGYVNGAVARRSPGSTLKPFVYAAAIQARVINDQSLVHDVRIERAGWSPRNFDDRFWGELPAAEALRRSLNIPAILIAEHTGLARCVGTIEAVGIDLPGNTEQRGGLAVVVGAIEVTLLDLVNGYATLGRGGIRRTPRLFDDETADQAHVLESNVCALIDDILSSRRRCPGGMEGLASREIPWFIWKTGTSSGRRDAWAVGHNRRYAIGVWVGRFSGVGSPAYVGGEVAEPLLADLFALSIVRTDRDPASPLPLPAPEALPLPSDLDGPLRIISPHRGAVYAALSDHAVIHPRANQQDGLTWFLDGKLIESASVDRLVLSPGRHDLRCVDVSGESAAVEFVVH